jgi:hypothetical protein
MPRYSLWALVRLPEGWDRLVRVASLPMVRRLAADREWVGDDLLYRRFPETAEKEQPRPKRPVQPPQEKSLSARKPPYFERNIGRPPNLEHPRRVRIVPMR